MEKNFVETMSSVGLGALLARFCSKNLRLGAMANFCFEIPKKPKDQLSLACSRLKAQKAIHPISLPRETWPVRLVFSFTTRPNHLRQSLEKQRVALMVFLYIFLWYFHVIPLVSMVFLTKQNNIQTIPNSSLHSRKTTSLLLFHTIRLLWLVVGSLAQNSGAIAQTSFQLGHLTRRRPFKGKRGVPAPTSHRVFGHELQHWDVSGSLFCDPKVQVFRRLTSRLRWTGALLSFAF